MDIYEDTKSFNFKIENGYIFRNMFEYLKLTNTKGIFIFSKNKIIYEQQDIGVKILNKIELDTSQLSYYHYEYKENSFTIGFNINDIRCITKLVNKNDSLLIYKNKYENVIHIDIIYNLTNKTSENKVIIRELESIIVNPPEYKRNVPNVVVKALEFTKMCTNISSMKCDNIKFEIYDTGIKCVATTFNISYHTLTLGEIYITETIETTVNGKKVVITRRKNQNLIECIYVKLKMIKCLSKLSNLSNKGNIEILIEPGLPLKFKTNIGNFGFIEVYIKSEEP